MPSIVRFDGYEVDVSAGQIRRRGARIRLAEQPFQVLAALLERPGELAARAPGQLGVIARTTAMRYKGIRKDVARIGRELNVDYVVEGGICREGDRTAITVQLVRASDQTHLFARRYEAALDAACNLRTCIAEAIIAHLDELSLPEALANGLAGAPH